MELKVNVGYGELQRRAYGEANFDRIIKQLKTKNKHSPITGSDTTKRINSLNKFIPGKYTKSLKLLCSDVSKHLVINNPLFMKKVK